MARKIGIVHAEMERAITPKVTNSAAGLKEQTKIFDGLAGLRQFP